VRGLFVAATDTGVGKTVVTGALAVALRRRSIAVGVAKPVQSGAAVDDPDGDAMQLRRAAAVRDLPAEICPYAFSAPLAPLVAARLEGKSVEPGVILARLEALAARHDVLLVEGAGGLLVPVGDDWTIADLASWTGLPLLIVARPGLGTVNHTLLTVAAARERGINVAGVVLNGVRDDTDASFETNPELIVAFGDIATVVTTPWIEGEPSELPTALAQHLDVEALLPTLSTQDAQRA
jgi:dethiobiotin synthetase